MRPPLLQEKSEQRLIQRLWASSITSTYLKTSRLSAGSADVPSALSAKREQGVDGASEETERATLAVRMGRPLSQHYLDATLESDPI